MEAYNPHGIEGEVSAYWKVKAIPDRIVKFKGKKKFYLLDGPPYVNFVPHVGHVMTTTFKDIWGKFKTMKGFDVWYQPGFDCMGLPIENAVEKKLGIENKKDIEDKVGIDKFIRECEKLAKGNEKVWMSIYKKIGAWRGWLDPYMTFENYYLESGWWTLKKLYEKGLLVEGVKPGFWCPQCETVLTGYEVSDSYKNLEDHSIYVKFHVAGKDEALLVWTTTPWTLPANVAIAVHPEEKYVKVRIGEQILILAEKRLEVLGKHKYKVLEKFPGKKLEGMKYFPLLDTPLQKELAKEGRSHKVIVSIPIMKKRVTSKAHVKKETVEKEEFGHIVDMETGSGLVHIAPGHGDVDNRIGKHYNLPEPSPVNEAGELEDSSGRYAGLFVKLANPKIIEDLDEGGKLFRQEKITHSCPLCWRCKTPLIYRSSKQWFLKVDTIKKNMLKENEKVRWLPEFARERFDNLLQEAPDWALTRQRYWGIPIPIWTCTGCQSKKVIGSRMELSKNAFEAVRPNTDIHKNTVDKIHLKCSCGGLMEREKDIMDVWFDSGISPWASIGYPFKNKAVFEKLWKVDLVDESLDHIRGWFYALMLCGYATFEEAPFNTVCMNGWTLDEKGEKMSKSLGNVVWAEDGLKDLGSDLLRLYYCHEVSPWETKKFNMRSAKELNRALNVLWNTYVFTKTYGGEGKPTHLHTEDKWIMSRINSLVKETGENYENFNFHLAGRGIVDFILNDFSRWYVKLVRDRVSPSYRGEDKASAQYVLRYVMERIVGIIAPITPFISEKIYTNLFRKESIHLSDFPKPDGKKINPSLENDMKVIKELIEVMNALRQEKEVKLRWPVSHLAVKPENKNIGEAVKKLERVIMIMGNVKEVKLEKTLKGKEFSHGKMELGEVIEEEAFLREVIRKVQSLRKQEKLDVKNKIILYLHTSKEIEEMLKGFEKELREGTGAKEVAFRKYHVKGSLAFGGKKVDIGFKKE
jgi:isoleucyl-tRNA synthetase